MRTAFAAAMCSALIGFLVASSPALAQKTVKACEDEWRANRAENQAKGITQKAYVAQCRAGGAATTTPTPTAPRTAPAAAAPKAQKTVKACQTEWRGNKAAYQAAGITEKAYVDKCRTGETVALPSTTPARPAPPPTATAPAPAPTVTAPAPAPTAATPARAPATRPAPTAATPPTGANQFQTEAQAKLRCPSDIVVWANLESKIYHFSGYKSYGTTKQGAYMCERDATGQGLRASKTEKRPTS